MTECECGAPVFIKKSGECKPCYQRRYVQEHAHEYKAGGRYDWRKYQREPRLNYTAKMPPNPALPITYQSAHRRVKEWRGRPSDHLCPCGQRAQDWSYDGGSRWELTGTKANAHGRTITVTWSPHINDYTALCKSCHTKRDRARKTG